MTGQKIKVLYSEIQTNGFHTLQLDASDLSSGMYFYILKPENENIVKKCILVK